MLVTEMAEILKLDIAPKDFVKLIRSIIPSIDISNELTPTINDNLKGDFIITNRGQEMLIDFLASMSEVDEKQKKQLKQFMKFQLRWNHIRKLNNEN